MIITALIVLGLALGSFVNALVWRLHEQSKPRKQRAAQDKDLSILTGRSMCPHCKHTLHTLDLLPLVSWLLLRGKCRYCRKPIDDTPLAEVGVATVFVLSYLYWPLSFNAGGKLAFAVWLLAVVAFAALVLYDLRWMLLPNKIVYPLIALAAMHVLLRVTHFDGGLSLLLRAGGGVLVAGGIFYVLYQASNGRWIGGGDVKLGFALGLLLMHPLKAMLMLFVASLLGILVTLPLLRTKRMTRRTQVPFGPFLIVATCIVFLWGERIINWYTTSVLSL